MFLEKNKNGMTIFSWNIQHGGGSRLNVILSELKKNSDSSVIILTEFRLNDNGLKIKDFLTELGFQYQFTPTDNIKINTVLVASKIEVEFSIDIGLGIHTHRVVSVKWSYFHLIAAYFPQRKEKRAVFNFLSTQLESNPLDTVLIVAGDMNTGIHYLDEREDTFFCSSDFQAIQAKGLLDAWRLLNRELREYSWYSNHGNGFRIDHFLITSGFRHLVKDCYYLHRAREEKVSDHSQMVLVLKQ